MSSIANYMPDGNLKPEIAPSTPPTNNKGWHENRRWLVPVVGVGASVMILIALTVVGAFIALKSSGACKTAIASAIADPAVIAALGSPIKEGWFVTGTLNPGHDADLTIPISGPKSGAKIHAVASKKAGKWTCSTLVVETIATRQYIPIVENPIPTKSSHAL